MVTYHPTGGGTVFSAELTDPTQIGTFSLPSSDDYGDPTVSQVITWHLSLCWLCKPDKAPEPFGVKSRKYCHEYWEIFEEYREYERDYALKGKP